jgi:predicted PhzF superfamily epimerase YddE/YHI9
VKSCSGSSVVLVDIPARVTILQGEDMGRPSRLLVDLAAGDERVQVTGTADPIPAA